MEVGKRDSSLGCPEGPLLSTLHSLCVFWCHRNLHYSFFTAHFVQGPSPPSAAQAVEGWKGLLYSERKEDTSTYFWASLKHPLKCDCVRGKTSSGKVTAGSVPWVHFLLNNRQKIKERCIAIQYWFAFGYFPILSFVDLLPWFVFRTDVSS